MLKKKIRVRYLAVVLCVALMCSTIAGCKPKEEKNNNSSASSTASQARITIPQEASPKVNTDTSKLIFSTDVWKSVPMVSQKLLDQGYKGGEGCQWPIYIICDPIDGNLAFLGTDVGGMYKSTDNGKNWTPCTIGLESCAATGMAIDPNNIKRVLAVGCNSYAYEKNGLYLSTDAGDTWASVYPAKVGGYRDFRQQIAFDESSYDKQIGGSKIVYWSREEQAFGAGNAEIHPALYKSEDGGKTWKEFSNSATYAHSVIAVHPQKGYVYCANSRGLFKSTDGGKTFKTILKGNIKGMDTIRTRPDNIYAIKDDGLYISKDCGNSFTMVDSMGYPTFNPNFIRVSPADPNRMVLQDNHLDKQGSDMDGTKDYYSRDGGRTWSVSDKGEGRFPGGTWIPRNSRQNPFSWNPKDKNIVLTLGGDFAMRSTDGGKTYKWSNAGYTGMMTGGLINWNVNHPDWLYNPSQDYNGGYTIDGGKTWTYIEWLADWGGFSYGGYVIDKNTVVAGVKSLGTAENPQKYTLRMTYDGGKNRIDTGLEIKGHQVGMGVLGNDNIVFMGEYRSTDKGRTWNEMADCDGVFTLDYKKGTLFGAKGFNVVMSKDQGKTWTQVGTTGNEPSDMAYNYKTGELFVLCGGTLSKKTLTQSTFKTVNYDSWKAKSVCVDPIEPSIMYVACAENIKQHEKSVMRSIDGGKNWVSLTRSVGDGRKGPDGGREATAIRVNAKTREVFVATCCRGLWKMPAPPKSTK